MSRLTELIAQAKAKDPQLGADLEQEYRVLASRRSFGLNFERHRPEAVELPQRSVRKGDKVRVLPPRGTTVRGDQRLWLVKALEEVDGARVASLELFRSDESESQRAAVEDLVVVAEFRDLIYPGLVSTGKVERGGDKPCHSVINGENYHVLKALTYTHRGKIDAIYIDPPYNTGARDWKYNNDYVESEDLYRHSKWLAFMERRLLVAKDLLKPSSSVLIVTIDEKEVHRLGLLLEQVFPEARVQMVTIVTNPNGVARAAELARVEEYAYFCFFGAAGPCRLDDAMLDQGSASEDESVRWERLMRGGSNSRRIDRPNLFFPLYIDTDSGCIAEVGEPLPFGKSVDTVPGRLGLRTVWPIRSSGEEATWRTSPSYLRELLKLGYARLGSFDSKNDRWSVLYLGKVQIRRIEAGEIEIVGRDKSGAVQLVAENAARRKTPKTVWNRAQHSAGVYGSSLLRTILPDRSFPFPKSLYAVEDALRVVLQNSPNATILDFFAGSGTTAQAVMRLNREDGGRRQSILVTNNEVGADEQLELKKKGFRPGDYEWENRGICDWVTKPRIKAAITGIASTGGPIKGDYKFSEAFPMADGFDENAEFFTLTYESPVAVSHDLAFERITPLLWMRAGSKGRRIDAIPTSGWSLVDTYGLLKDLDRAEEFCAAISTVSGIRVAYIVTDDDRRFQAVAKRLPEGVEPVRLYESYLSNFRFASGE